MAKKSKGDKVPRCEDYDSDCEHLDDHLKCFLHDPIRGYCPYLRKKPDTEERENG